MGKTTCLDLELPAIRDKVNSEGTFVATLDLAAVDTSEKLSSEIGSNVTIGKWKRAKSELLLFIDSLDECRLVVPKIANILLAELEKLPMDRLRLRIFCRSAELPAILERGLQERFSRDEMQVYELQPLTIDDVRLAATALDVDDIDQFLESLLENDAVTFASTPRTLVPLIRRYLRGDNTPTTRYDLYKGQLLKLCNEPNISRIAANQVGSLDPEQRFAIACRIAAILTFCGCAGIDFENDPDETTNGFLLTTRIAGRWELLRGNRLDVLENKVRETISHTSIFRSLGHGLFGFAHKTWQEFLAAEYLHIHGLPPQQIRSLITHAGEDGPRIIPQQQEVAAWIADAIPEIRKTIIQSEPQLVVKGDVAVYSISERRSLVRELLAAFEMGKILRTDWSLREHYAKLNHPSIAKQIGRFIKDSKKPLLARRAAIEIAECCKLKSLQKDLLHIALTKDEGVEIRIAAAAALSRNGNKNVRRRLKPLLQCDDAEDPEDELKGCALMGLWPEHLSAKELFDLLSPKKVSNLFGVYDGFIRSHVIDGLSHEDIPIALKWTEKQPSRFSMQYAFQDLLNGIFTLAIEQLDTKRVMRSLASAFIKRSEFYDKILEDRQSLGPPEKTTIEDDLRHPLICEIIKQAPNDKCQHIAYWLTQESLITGSDLGWMLQKFKCSRISHTRKKWLICAQSVFDRTSRGDFDQVAELSMRYPEVRNQFRWALGPIELESEEASNAKERHEWMIQWEQERKNTKVTPSSRERVFNWLDRFEKGEIGAWWMLNRDLTLEPDSTHYGDGLESDLTRLPGWSQAEDQTKKRIVDAAVVYLKKANPRTAEWLGSKSYAEEALAGYRAVRLLASQDENLDDIIRPKDWKRWAPIILAYPTAIGIVGQDEPHLNIVFQAYRHAPKEIIKTLNALIDKDNDEGNTIFIIRKMERCWDDRLKKAVLEHIKDTHLKASCEADLLEEVLKHGLKQAEAYTRTLIPSKPPQDENKRDLAMEAASLLVMFSDNCGWDLIWPAVQRNTGFGKDVMLSLSYGRGRHGCAESLGKGLSEDDLADLYVWLERKFPQKEDPKETNDTMQQIGPRHEVGYFRDKILTQLRSRGTANAAAAVRRIKSKLPHLIGLDSVELEARTMAIASAWCPPTPEELLDLIFHCEKRFVETGEDLVEALLDSLTRMQERIDGKFTLSWLCWNRWRNEKDECFEPISEEVLSDFVADHLLLDLAQRQIFVNREVQIKRTSPSGRPKSTDIHVEALSKAEQGSNANKITAIIEVKRCDNKDLLTAMTTQLCDDYLRPSGSKYGIYLVGWYTCKKWKPRRRPNLTLSEARTNLKRQADSLSTDGLHIRTAFLDLRLPNS